MTPEQYERAKRLFERATRLPSQEFARFLDEEESDAEVREAVAAMLAFEARCPDFLAGSPLDSNATLEEDFSRPLAVPDQIAGFRILGRLGAGAMGTVFEAEQHSPKRRVALKVLTHLRGSHASEERFRREAEVLARLEHPGIARVIQSGTAIIGDDRVHYIALERIDGLPLDEHCRKRQLPDHRRIELLAQIADAVQHAHARGIVHRDLKPSNILVDKGGMPKVLDFGIARLVDDGSDEIRGVTLAGQVLGTLAYMSPEQASADGQVGVAADIFALGAILYDLLAGAPPHDLGSLSLSQALHRISHVRPTPLSSRCPRAKGDLGTIVDKALELLPERRYSSALAFGDDLRRFLAHEPISARPATFGYRAYRFVQRHRALSASLAITALAVVSSTILAWVLFARAEASRIEALEGRDRARRAERAAEAGRLEAERQRGIAEAVLGYLIRVFDAANPELTPEGRWLTAPELLRVATLGLSDSFTDQPEVHAAVLRALARVQSALSLPEEAEASLSRALERLESSTDDALRLTIRLDRITALLELGRLDEARLELDRCEQATTGSDTPHQRGQLLLARAGLAHAEAQYDIARTAIETALATAKSSEDSSVLLGAYDALGQL
ncbi:MAG: serine/threonine-protein kinase, partial [Planctomycetota bacterium]